MLAKGRVIGRIVAEPELKEAGGTPLVNFTLASNRKYKGEDIVDYFDFVVWGKRAETFASYKHQGDLVEAEGRMQIKKWEKDGQTRSKLQIVADDIVYLPSKNDAKHDNGGKAPAGNNEDFDDIPF